MILRRWAAFFAQKTDSVGGLGVLVAKFWTARGWPWGCNFGCGFQRLGWARRVFWTRMFTLGRKLSAVFFALAAAFAHAENPKRVVITYHYMGGGHAAAAESLKKVILEKDPTAEVELVNLQKFVSPQWLAAADRTAYQTMLRLFPARYQRVFDAASQSARTRGVTPPPHVRAFVKMDALAEHLKNTGATTFLATDEFTAQVAAYLKSQGKIEVPIGWMVTDYRDDYSAKILNAMDSVFVGHPALREAYIQNGVQSEKVQALGGGILVDAPAHDQAAARAALEKRGLKLADDKKTVVIGGGKLGLSGDARSILKQLAAHTKEPLQVVVLTGTDQRQLRRLQRLQGALPQIDVIPMPHVSGEFSREIVAAADLFITKPGGIAPTEAIRMRVPLLLTNTIGGHETMNYDHYLREGVAAGAGNAQQTGTMAALLLRDSGLRQTMRQNQERFAPESGVASDRAALAAFALEGSPPPYWPTVAPSPVPLATPQIDREAQEIDRWIESSQGKLAFQEELEKQSREFTENFLKNFSAEEKAQWEKARQSTVRRIVAKIWEAGQAGKSRLAELKRFLMGYGRTGGISYVVAHIVKNGFIAFPLYGISAMTGNKALLALTIAIHQGPWDFGVAFAAAGTHVSYDTAMRLTRLRSQLGRWDLSEHHQKETEVLGLPADSLLLRTSLEAASEEFPRVVRVADALDSQGIISLQTLEDLVRGDGTEGARYVSALAPYRGDRRRLAAKLMSYAVLKPQLREALQNKIGVPAASPEQSALLRLRDLENEAVLMADAVRAKRDTLIGSDRVFRSDYAIIRYNPIPVVQVARVLVREAAKLLPTRFFSERSQATSLALNRTASLALSLNKDLRSFRERVELARYQILGDLLETQGLDAADPRHAQRVARLDERVARAERELAEQSLRAQQMDETLARLEAVPPKNTEKPKQAGVLNAAEVRQVFEPITGQHVEKALALRQAMRSFGCEGSLEALADR